MTLPPPILAPVHLSAGPGAAYKYGSLGLAGDDPASRRLAFTRVFWVKIAIPARRYNAVTLNDMLFARYQSRLLVWPRLEFIGCRALLQ